MARLGLARLALTAVVVLLLVVAQVQIWSAASAYDLGGRALNAALAAAMTLPILLARRWPLPMALVQHRHRTSDSLLSRLLQEHTRLRVCEAEDKMPIPHVGWFTHCTDTEGNAFSLFHNDESVTG